MRTSRSRTGTLTAAVSLVTVVLAAGRGSAQADVTKDRCVSANADAQAMRLDGKLSAARAQLDVCVDRGCPSIVREDCARRLDELEKAQPTIVFDVKDAGGSDVSAVTVTVDGKPLVERLTGSALAVDPGEHIFLFTVSGRPPVGRRFILKEGEKDRRERILLGRPGGVPGGSGSGNDNGGGGDRAADDGGSGWRRGYVAPKTVDTGLGTQRIFGLTLGAIGIVGVAAGTVFGILTFNAVSAQKNDCTSPTNCVNHNQAETDHSNATKYGNISTISFIAGGALVAAGELLLFTAPKREEVVEAASLSVSPSVGPGAAGLMLRGGF